MLLMVMIAGLNCRLLTALSLWLGSIIARQKVTQTVHFDLLSQALYYF